MNFKTLKDSINHIDNQIQKTEYHELDKISTLSLYLVPTDYIVI